MGSKFSFKLSRDFFFFDIAVFTHIESINFESLLNSIKIAKIPPWDLSNVHVLAEVWHALRSQCKNNIEAAKNPSVGF